MIKPILRTILILLVCSLAASTMNAQDIHYSQFYQSPMSLNPALTGHMPAKFRVNGMYRDQWPQVPVGGTTYRTYMVGFDANLLRTKDQYNSLGLGIHIMNDESGAGKLNATDIMVSAAYHLDLQKNMKYYISAGLQAGVMNKRLDVAEILFGSQIDANGEPTLPSNEIFDNESIFMPDFRFGLTFAAFPSYKTRYKIGVGLFHLLQPSETFVGIQNKLPLRIAAHADARFGFGSNARFGIEPRAFFQTQAKAMELVPGLLFDIGIMEKASLYLGGEIRLDGSVDGGIGADAGIAVIGLRISDWDVGVSYDFNISPLDNATNGQGGLELSLLKIFRRAYSVEPILPAIRYN